MTTFIRTVSRRSQIYLFLSGFALALFLPDTLRAQVGNDNPTGPSGTYNGSVSTGGSYDPYTGNATRTITDMVVAGTVGDYSLSFTRTSNSRGVSSQFGAGGGWQHPFTWSIDDVQDLPDGQPIPYTVNFPDGRVEEFGPAGAQSGIWPATTRGVPERLQPWDGTYCYLLLRDGGKIQFLVTWTSYYDGETHQTYYNFSFTAEAIIDPHGLATTFSYDANGNLSQVTEPAGRWIQIFYTTASGMTVIDYIRASDGREVHYTYATQVFSPGVIAYSVLTNVVYFGDSSVTATYGYQAPNVGDANGFPLLVSCDDPMYPGPMKRISYTYATGNNPDDSAAVYGQILSENSSTTGQPVSTLTINSPTTRTETRGDGPSRAFNYNNGQLTNYTDFKNQTSYLFYDGNGYVSAFQDARNNVTSTSRESRIGALTVLTHPGDNSTARFSYTDANNPYYLYYRTDELWQTTWFTRNGNHQVERIDYPNGGYETFAYNGFGQVYSHRMTSGGTETRYIDGRGMMWASNNPDGTTYYYYDGNDRLEHVTDPRSNTTWFQYNARGQITRVTHMDGSYLQYGYNVDGTLFSMMDELGHVTTFAYDDYKRVVSVTNPLYQTTSYVYAQDWANPYVQTTSNIKGAFSPMGKQVHYAYDENWQRTIMRIPPGADPNDAWTFYGYDAAGNLTWTQDPRGHATTFGYDNRNRRTSATDALNQTTSWQYDATNNVIRETRADQSYRTMAYDSMNRVIDTNGFASEHTHYDHDLAGNVWQMIDAKGASYTFGYDAMNRKVSATYPGDAYGVNRTEIFWYDGVGNLVLYKNPADQYRHINYDSRNHPWDSWWDGGAGPSISTRFDAASRLSSVTTNGGETTVSFGYDEANRKIWEDQTLSGYPTRRVNTARDADGNRTYLDVPNYYHIDYGYNQRNQLSAIGSFANFHYDGNGNMTNRELVWGYTNETNFAYDELNRVTQTELGANGWIYARSHYQYDSLSRQVATWRDEQSSKGERYWYTADGQLSVAEYNADQVWVSPQNWDRWVGYTYTGDTLNRQSVNDNGTVTGYTPDGINQYTTVGSQGIGYDAQFNISSYNGNSFSYNAQNQLTGGSMQATYDGLGRCVRRVTSSGTRLYTYDGWKPMLEWDQWGNFLAWNVYGAGPDEILVRGDSTYGTLIYKQDHHGNVVGLLDGGGNVIEKYTYDAFGQPTVTDYWGNVRGNTSWYGNRFMFQGREWIAELGVYDFRNRYYQPQLGRFLQSDPLGFGGGDANLFRYGGGDPVNHSDPSGMVEVKKQNEAMGGAVGEATTDTVVVDAPYDWSQGSFEPLGPGGLESLNQGGGLNGGGSLGSLPPLARDSSAKGTVPKAPKSTQGFWTDMSGLPTGPTVFILTDEWLIRVLNEVVGRVNAAEARPDAFDIGWKVFMFFLDTEFFNEQYHDALFSYSGMFTQVHGTWAGYQINYIGVGAGFAGHGWSGSQMANKIGEWNYGQYHAPFTSEVVFGKMLWAEVGYNYYLGHH